MTIERRKRVVTLVLFGFAAATVLALLAFIFVGPKASVWVTDEAEWTWIEVEAYTENLHVLKKAKAGDTQAGTGGVAAELLEIRERTLREIDVADDDRRVAWGRFRVKARLWRDGPMTAGGGVVAPTARFEFLAGPYMFDGWVIRWSKP